MIASERITFKSQDAELEAELYLPESANGGVVIQHPHPSFGGDMYNNVVEGVWKAAKEAGLAAFRFNMRGVGRSAGEHTNLQKEPDDGIEAVNELASRGVKSIGMIGYSFGAMATLLAAQKTDKLSAIAVIGPPLMMADPSVITSVMEKTPTLVIVGTDDQFCPLSQLNEAGIPFESVEGTDHFLVGRESAVGKLAVEFISGNMAI